MTKYYFIRHAESLANARGIYQGQTYDTGLTLRGKKQAKKMAELFRGKKLDLIITSPLKRTLETAEELMRPTNTQIFIEPLITETNHGLWEGKNKNQIKETWTETYKKWLTNPADVAFPEGETFKETRERVIAWWRKAKTSNDEIAVVTHDNIIRIIIAETLDLKLDNIWKFNLLPTAVTIVEKNDGGSKLVLLNDTRHLKENATNIAAHAL